MRHLSSVQKQGRANPDAIAHRHCLIRQQVRERTAGIPLARGIEDKEDADLSASLQGRRQLPIGLTRPTDLACKVNDAIDSAPSDPPQFSPASKMTVSNAAPPTSPPRGVAMTFRSRPVGRADALPPLFPGKCAHFPENRKGRRRPLAEKGHEDPTASPQGGR